MFVSKILAVAALAVAAVAHGVPAPEICALASTVTVTVTECATEPVNPGPTPPGSYAPPPATLVESTATAPNEPEVTPSILPPPRTSEPVVPPTTEVPVVPSSGVVPSGEAPSSTVITSTSGPSSTINNVRPSSSASAPPAVSTAGAVLGTPLMKLGSLFVAGAAAVAVVA